MTEIKILVVEDELIAAESLALDLQRQGYQVVGIADSGIKAINTIPQTKPDLIIMDILLKGDLDGISTTEQIRNSYPIPVVYLTAYADQNTLDRAKQTSPYGYLVKPYKPQDLSTTIEIALTKYQEERQMEQKLQQEKRLSTLRSHALSIASHDLRTPLATILSSSELLRYYGEKWSSEQKTKHFQRIESTVLEMTELLEDLLTTRKLEEGKLLFQPFPLDIVKFCQHIIENFRPNLNSKHQLIFICNHQYYQGCFDEKLLRHILLNLISNACKYSPEGGKIILRLTCELQKIILQVQDEGIGMSTEDQGNIFQIFERANNVGNIKGTGLGLYIVKQAVRLHKGMISVTSQEGIGTCFTIKIPAVSP